MIILIIHLIVFSMIFNNSTFPGQYLLIFFLLNHLGYGVLVVPDLYFQVFKSVVIIEHSRWTNEVTTPLFICFTFQDIKLLLFPFICLQWNWLPILHWLMLEDLLQLMRHDWRVLSVFYSQRKFLKSSIVINLLCDIIEFELITLFDFFDGW